jgi:hypothetical protein
MAQPSRDFDSTSFEEIEVDLETASQRLRQLQKERDQARATRGQKTPAAGSTGVVAAEKRESSTMEVHVVDVDIPLTSLIWLFGKAAFAAVPAGTLLWFFWMGLSTTLPEIFASIWPG